jgi:hypothetical protein
MLPVASLEGWQARRVKIPNSPHQSFQKSSFETVNLTGK